VTLASQQLAARYPGNRAGGVERGPVPAQIISARRSEVTPDGSSASATSATCALRPPRPAPVTVPAWPVTAGVPSMSIRTH
jgi:hypothetical protein